jgi:hypothetical protein
VHSYVATVKAAVSAMPVQSALHADAGKVPFAFLFHPQQTAVAGLELSQLLVPPSTFGKPLQKGPVEGGRNWGSGHVPPELDVVEPELDVVEPDELEEPPPSLPPEELLEPEAPEPPLLDVLDAGS